MHPQCSTLLIVGWHLLGYTWVAAKALLSCINRDRDERVHRVVQRQYKCVQREEDNATERVSASADLRETPSVRVKHWVL